MSVKIRSKQPLVATLIDVAEVLIVVAYVVVLSLLMSAIVELSWWLNLLVFVLASLVTGVSVFYLKGFKASYLEKAGYGISVLNSAIKRAGRSVIADTFQAPKMHGSLMGLSYIVSETWTRIRVGHGGRPPCVMEVTGGNRQQIRFLDRDVYREWQSRQENQRRVPGKVNIGGRRVVTACSEEVVSLVLDKAGYIFEDEDIAAVRGIIRIEPEQVLFLQKADHLSQDYLEMVVDLLIRLAIKVETEYRV